MPSQSVVYLILVSIFSVKGNYKDFCGNRMNFLEPKGIIETDDTSGVFKNCTWFIKTPKQSVVYIKIENLQLGGYGDQHTKTNCLKINSPDKNQIYLKLCSDTDYFNVVSIPTNELEINLEITSESFLSLSYTSYVVNCTYDELLCFNSRFFPRKPGENCFGGMLICDSSCKNKATICGDFCFDIFQQRCNGILDCTNGEDELGCNPWLCPNGILCSNDTKCVETIQICDKNVDCTDGFDESHCPKSFCDDSGASCYIERNITNKLEREDNIYVVIIIFAILAILFLCTLFRCLTARQNVRHLLDNSLDIPLPPFRGPGAGSSTMEEQPFTEEDFKPGGEIYESFTKNLKKIKSKRKNMLEIEETGITFVKPPPGKEALEKYFHGVKPVLSEELAALATLKITRDMCYGLRKTKSEEIPMTKLLFIDQKDDNISDDSDTENQAGSSNWGRDLGRNVYPKSDSDYVRRKNVEITIV